ncbi:hypothetical protein ACO0RG_001887 [Hanseniaspora osmophila]
MESLIGLVARGSSSGGRLGKVFTYIRYLLLVIAVITFIKKMFLTADPDDLKLMPDERMIPKPTTFGKKFAYRLMKAQFKSKGLALKDYGKSLERREYEKNLNLLPKGSKEVFLNHPKPNVDYQNITAWVYDADRKEKLTSYNDSVPTIEYIKYANSLDPAQLLIPAWSPSDTVDFSYYITAYPEFDIGSSSTFDAPVVHELLKDINLQNNHQISILPFVFDLPKDSQNLYMHAFMKKSKCKSIEFQDDDTCLISSNKTIKLTYTDPDTGKSYYHPLFQITLAYNNGDLLLSSVAEYFKPHLIVDDFTGKRDNSSGVATRYFPYIEYESFWQRKTELIEINDSKLSFEVEVNIGNVVALQAKLRVLDYFLQKFLSIPFTTVKSLQKFDFKFDSFKGCIVDNSQAMRYFCTSLVILQFVFGLLGFTSEAPINGGMNSTSHLLVAGLQFMILLYLLSQAQYTSVMVYFSTILASFSNVIKANELYDKKFYEKNELKPEKFKASKQLGEKTLIFQERYPKCLPFIEPEFETYRDDVAAPTLVICFGLLGAAYGIYNFFKDDSSVISLNASFLATLSYGVGILNDSFILYQNNKFQKIVPLSKELIVFKSALAVINIAFLCVAKMPIFHALYLISPTVIFFVYLYQTKHYKHIQETTEQTKPSKEIANEKEYKKNI